MKKMRFGLTVVMLVLSLTVVKRTVYAADGFSQLQIVTQYPIKSIIVSGVNQNDDAATYEQEFVDDSNTTVLSIFDWWWRFKFFAEVECTWYQRVFGGCDDSDFPQPDAISPYVWVRYIDGTLKHKRCTPPTYYSTIANMVTCNFAYDGPEGEEDSGDGPDESANPDYDSDGDGVPDAQDWCLTIGDEGYGLDNNGCPIPPPDLAVAEVSPVQVVYDANFDTDNNSELIMNKPLAVRIKLEIASPSLIQDDQLIGIQASLQGKMTTKEFRASEVKDGKYIYLVLADTPNKVENGVMLSVIADPTKKLKESNEDNNQKDVPVDVLETHGFNANYMRVGIGDFDSKSPFTPRAEKLTPPSAEDALAFKNKSENFLDSIYPISPNNINHRLLETSFVFSQTLLSDNLTKACQNAAEDNSFDCALVLAVFAEGQAKSERVVGLIPMDYLGPNTFGFTFSNGLNGAGSTVVIVGTHASNRTVAHEVGHTYGLHDRSSEHGESCQDGQVNGFWVTANTVAEKFDMMCSGSEATLNHVNKGWIIPTDFSSLYHTFESQTTTSLSSIIIAGSISAQKQVSIYGPFWISEGIVAPTGNTMSFETFDWQGNVITVTPFGLFDEKVSVSGANSPLENPVFMFAAGFPNNAVYAQITEEQQSIYKFNIHSSLLRQAVDSLPDKAFVKHPEQTRKTLYNQITALEKQYERADINGVINHLEAIRNYADLSLLSSYKSSAEIEYSHDKFLKLIDELLTRLR